MRKYAIIGSLLILGVALAGRAVSLAQKSSNGMASGRPFFDDSVPYVELDETRAKPPELVALPNIPIVDVGADQPATLDNRPQLSSYQEVKKPPVHPNTETDLKNDDRQPVLELPPHKIHPTNLLLVSGVDPMGTIETFVVRNKKEADQSIELLNQEAETLRNRLQKVEAALARWQAVSKALDARQVGPSAELSTTRIDTTPDTTAETKASVPAESSENKPPVPLPSNPPVELPATLPPAGTLPPSPVNLPAAPDNLPPAETKPVEPAAPALPAPVETKPTQPTAEPFPALPETKPTGTPPGGVDLPEVPAPKIREVPESSV